MNTSNTTRHHFIPKGNNHQISHVTYFQQIANLNLKFDKKVYIFRPSEKSPSENIQEIV